MIAWVGSHSSVTVVGHTLTVAEAVAKYAKVAAYYAERKEMYLAASPTLDFGLFPPRGRDSSFPICVSAPIPRSSSRKIDSRTIQPYPTAARSFYSRRKRKPAARFPWLPRRARPAGAEMNDRALRLAGGGLCLVVASDRLGRNITRVESSGSSVPRSTIVGGALCQFEARSCGRATGSPIRSSRASSWRSSPEGVGQLLEAAADWPAGLYVIRAPRAPAATGRAARSLLGPRGKGRHRRCLDRSMRRPLA